MPSWPWTKHISLTGSCWGLARARDCTQSLWHLCCQTSALLTPWTPRARLSGLRVRFHSPDLGFLVLSPPRVSSALQILVPSVPGPLLSLRYHSQAEPFRRKKPETGSNRGIGPTEDPFGRLEKGHPGLAGLLSTRPGTLCKAG